MMLRFFALAAVLRSAAAKNQNRDRAFRARQREGETQACAGLPPGTGANCVHACISQTCFDEVYAEEPLEDGEVDSKRARAFQRRPAETELPWWEKWSQARCAEEEYRGTYADRRR